ncbi:MAG: biotin--[acetyl-CoA-carboxylase] ligase [Nitrospirae bacterium]|nr:biotin--[acetyl-CoA-carboxylase] ligase [Nitrospirota bacterium]MCL5977162.1 biotin--[acetyl-CoA-carboxylase] ligase [Nitrospirota bacterium]
MKNESPDMSIEEIKSALSGHTSVVGKKIIFLETVNSTNTHAMELAGKGCEEGSVVIADAQTGGKGRLGRKWLSPAGKNIYMSIVLKPQLSPRDATILTLMSAVSCATAVKKCSSIPVTIKWPNDLMVSGKKLGGILTEIKADMDRISHAVIGIGINVNIDPTDMPAEIGSFATSLKIEQKSGSAEVWNGYDFPRTLVAIEIIKELDRWYSILLNTGKKPITDAWMLLSSTIGRTVKVTVGNAVFTGIAEGIDDEGMLMLKLPDNSIKKINSGDIAILR